MGFLGGLQGRGGVEQGRRDDGRGDGGRRENWGEERGDGLTALLNEAVRAGGGRGGGERGGREEEEEEDQGWENLEGGEPSRGVKRVREEDFPWYEDTRRFNKS